MKGFAGLTAWAVWALPLVSFAEGVRYRGIFVNDEDWGLRPWAVQDNFIRVDVPIPPGAKTATITAVDPGVVIDRVGIR